MKRINKLLLIVLPLTIINVGILFYNLSLFKISNFDNKKNYIRSDSPKVNNYATRDVEYKLFYGEWRVNRIIGLPKNFPIDLQGARSIIGQTVRYTFDDIRINGEVKVRKPEYFIDLIPITPNKIYIGGLPSLDDIGVGGKYFAFVQVNNAKFSKDKFTGTGGFYVKDDSTLIMYENEVYYELKRISCIKNANDYQVHP